MEEKTLGIVLSVKKQWWLKVNTKAVRKGTLDGAIFPHTVKVRYTVGGKDFVKKKWLGPSVIPPKVNDEVTIIYRKENPKKFRIEI